MGIVEKSPNFRNGKFRNIFNNKFETPASVIKILTELFTGGQKRIPDSYLPRISPDMDSFKKNNEGLKIIWFGHSTVLINIDGFIILTDPVFEEKVTFAGPKRYSGKIPIKIENLPEIDVIIISHNHYDHLNKESVIKLEQKTKMFITALGVGNYLEKFGISRKKIVETDWWDETKINDNLMIATTPSQHFSGRGLRDRDKSLWASWVIKTREHSLFFSGDSGYFSTFKKIGENYGPFDATLMECGQYNDNWYPIHMRPKETLQAHIDLQGKILIPVHWGSFRLALHDWNEPVKILTEAAEKINVTVSTPQIGELVELNRYIPIKKWWNF